MPHKGVGVRIPPSAPQLNTACQPACFLIRVQHVSTICPPNSENGFSVPIDQRPELPRRIPLLTGEDVGIKIQGNLDALVAEALLHDVWRYAG